MIEVHQHIGTIHKAIHDSCQDKSGSHIEQRMLFDEYGRHNNRSTQEERTASNAPVFFQLPASHNSYMAAKRIVNMNAGP